MIYKLSDAVLAVLKAQSEGSWYKFANSVHKDALFVSDREQEWYGRVYVNFVDKTLYNTFFKGNHDYKFTFNVNDLIPVEENIIQEYLNSTTF